MRVHQSLVPLLVAFGVGAPRLALAQTAVECAESFEQGQVDRAQLHYGAAKRSFVTCSQLTCPQPIVKDCVEALESVEREVPMFGFRVRDPDGQELLEVRILIDNELLTAHLDGSMFQRDPGVYRLRIETADFKPLETTLSLHPGERTRVIEVKLAPRHPRPASGAAPPAPVIARPASPPFRFPLPSLIAAGAGAIAFGGFLYFRNEASQGYDSLGECRPYCSEERIDNVRTQYLLSNLALGVSGAALATAGITLWLLQPRNESQSQSQSLALELRPASAALTTRF